MLESIHIQLNEEQIRNIEQRYNTLIEELYQQITEQEKSVQGRNEKIKQLEEIIEVVKKDKLRIENEKNIKINMMIQQIKELEMLNLDLHNEFIVKEKNFTHQINDLLKFKDLYTDVDRQVVTLTKKQKQQEISMRSLDDDNIELQ